jgi:tagatose-1,6-bisphosphate aldolase
LSLEGISDRGRFAVLALDHRDSFRNFLRPDDPLGVAAEELTALKIELVAAAAGEATGVMLESEYSIPQVIDAGVLPPGVGFVAALEAQGYMGDLGARPTELMPDWSPAAARAAGASACKLLLPFHPDRELADAQAAVAAEVVASCHDAGLPLVLEPLFYDLDDPADRPRVVIETASRFAQAGADLLKLPFPVDTSVDADTDHWFAACRTISELVPSPWVVLSGGGDFDSFAAQVEVARSAGNAGFMVGRALWGEAVMSAAEDRPAQLELVRLRLARLRQLLD